MAFCRFITCRYIYVSHKLWRTNSWINFLRYDDINNYGPIKIKVELAKQGHIVCKRRIERYDEGKSSGTKL